MKDRKDDLPGRPVNQSACSQTEFGREIWDKISPTLPDYLARSRWFSGKSRKVVRISLLTAVALDDITWLAIFSVEYKDGESQTYSLPLMLVQNAAAHDLKEVFADRVLSEPSLDRVIFDCSGHERFGRLLFRFIAEAERIACAGGFLQAFSIEQSDLRRFGDTLPAVRLLKGEQSNTSLVLGEEFYLKLFRRLESEVNPEVEMAEHLSCKAGFKNTPQSLGFLEFRGAETAPTTIAFLARYVANQGDCWSVFQNMLSSFCSAHAGRAFSAAPAVDFAAGSPHTALVEAVPEFRASFSMAALLGKRTAEMHRALAQDFGNGAFKAQELTFGEQQQLCRSLLGQLDLSLKTLRQTAGTLSGQTKVDAELLLSREAQIRQRFTKLLERPLQAGLTRIHGDLHLGQILYNGADFFFIDFEGEPARSMSERKKKHSPLRDVAGMLRSFHYAAYVARDSVGAAGRELQPWLRAWHYCVSRSYLEAYLAAIVGTALIPPQAETSRLLLDIFCLEKALYELTYELNNRPDWASVPLTGILDMLKEA